jgi:hypothetical protein
MGFLNFTAFSAGFFSLNTENNGFVSRKFIFHRYLTFVKNHRIRRDTFDNPNVSADDGIFTNHRVTA